MKRKIIAILILIQLPLMALCALKKNSAYELYIAKYKDLAIEQMHRHKIPASITLAQGLLESGAGNSELARKANNHFGIKCHNWNGKRMYHDDDRKDDCFRSYNSVYESYEDHSRFLVSGQRYSKLFKLKITDYKGWAKGLKAAGYATNPKYASKLIEIIELYELYEYDREKKTEKFVPVIKINNNVSIDNSHKIYQFNNNLYIKARQGDTFKSIGKEVGISYYRLADFNERDKNDVLAAGDIIYLKKKAKKAPKQFKNKKHVVK
ncbi:MAG: glucosaminidase domain-containing protein, partial [Prevotella sp.]|nr:glucosaminidase domain-containing protein [Prevotella sp.]